jgi:hypothetical protein
MFGAGVFERQSEHGLADRLYTDDNAGRAGGGGDAPHFLRRLLDSGHETRLPSSGA